MSPNLQVSALLPFLGLSIKKAISLRKPFKKVNEAMRELGYKPNNLARSLQGKSAKLIGLIFPNISNVFYAELIDKLEHQLFKKWLQDHHLQQRARF